MIVNVSSDSYISYRLDECQANFGGSTTLQVNMDLNCGSGGACGTFNDNKYSYLFFNLSRGLTNDGNFVKVPWYLVKNATLKIWALNEFYKNYDARGPAILVKPVLQSWDENTLYWQQHYHNDTPNTCDLNATTFVGDNMCEACHDAAGAGAASCCAGGNFTTNSTVEFNITSYVINQSKYNNNADLTLVSSDGSSSWQVSFSSKEWSNSYGLKPYLEIYLNDAYCGDGYCTSLNETFANCPQDCSNINYIEVNGTTFIQPAAINITCWSSNSSVYTYLWNNYTGAIQSMLPNGTGTQTNITQSSRLSTGVYSVYCNSTWNSTLASKSFTVVSAENYIEVNGTTFIQPAAINITCWSSNSSVYTYLWNNYTGAIQSMLPNGTGTQTNITQSSRLSTGVYSVYCNSTWNSTLASKSFTVVTSTTTTTVSGGGDGGGGGGGGGITTTKLTTTYTTTTFVKTTTSTIVTSALQTTTTIPVKVSLKIWEIKVPLWIILVTILIVTIIVAIFYVIIKRRDKVTVLDVKLDDYNYDYE